MKIEIYRSFEAPLDYENQEGFVVYELPMSYEIEHLSVVKDAIFPHYRFPKTEAHAGIDWGSERACEWLTQMYQNIDHGHVDGASVLYNGGWYRPKEIIDRNAELAAAGKISQDPNVVYNWRAALRSDRRWAQRAKAAEEM